MTIQQQIRQAQRLQRELLAIERAYFREINRMFRAWFKRLLQRISDLTGLKLTRFDALTDDLMPEFNRAVDDWINAARQLQGSINRHAQQVVNVVDPLSDLISDIRGTQRNIARYQQTVAPILDPQIMDALKDFAAENAELVKNLGRDAAERLQAIVLDALRFNTPKAELEEQIRKLSKAIGQTRARTIANDQIGKLQGRITQLQAQRNGQTKYRWVSQQDRRVRDSHRALNGTVRSWSQSPIPGQEINCRCIAIPLTE